MIDYTIFYKTKLSIQGGWGDHWDIFLSAYNSSGRVRSVFELVSASVKHWLVHPEYEYNPDEYPDGEVFAPPRGDEAEFLSYYFGRVGTSLSGSRVCVDITGFMRPHLMLLMQFLVRYGVKKFDVLYSEPGQYVNQERTRFAGLPVIDVRPVLGFEGSHLTDSSNDLFIIGSGYDHPLISHAAEHKKSARKIQLFGFPSLRPDMFQENVLNARQAEEAIGAAVLDGPRTYFAPANDPFVVASVLQAIARQEEASVASRK